MADQNQVDSRSLSLASLGLGAPATRALAGAELIVLSDLAGVSRDFLKQLHGVGPSALTKLDGAMQIAGLQYSRSSTRLEL